MPRLTDTLKQELEITSEHFDRQRDRHGGIQAELTRVRALIHIAEKLDELVKTLDKINTNLEGFQGRTILEEPPSKAPVRRSTKK